MSDESGAPGEGSSAEERMRRAREDLDRIVEDLVARTRSEPGSSGPAPDPDPYARVGPEPGGQVGAGADEIEARLTRTVEARVGAAERRLQLQAQALEAALGEEAQQARAAAEGLERMQASLDEDLEERKRAFREEAEGGVREIVGEARLELDGKVTELEREIGELRSQLAATARVSAERSSRASASIEEGVGRLRSELDEMRGEMSKRSIRRERKRLEDEGAARLGSLEELHAAKLAELDEHASRQAEALSERVSRGLEAGLADAASSLERERDEVLERLEEAASRRVEEGVDAAVAVRSEGFEERLEQVTDRLSEEAAKRIRAAAEAAEQRLAAAERAQQREEEVNRRIREAEAEAGERVRAAERRLVDVLGRLAPSGSGPLARGLTGRAEAPAEACAKRGFSRRGSPLSRPWHPPRLP